MTTVATASRIETRFVWKPRIKDDDLPAPLRPSGDDPIELVLKGRISTSLGSTPGLYRVELPLPGMPY